MPLRDKYCSNVRLMGMALLTAGIVSFSLITFGLFELIAYRNVKDLGVYSWLLSVILMIHGMVGMFMPVLHVTATSNKCILLTSFAAALIMSVGVVTLASTTEQIESKVLDSIDPNSHDDNHIALQHVFDCCDVADRSNRTLMPQYCCPGGCDEKDPYPPCRDIVGAWLTRVFVFYYVMGSVASVATAIVTVLRFIRKDTEPPS